jgi:hypothetical protein
MFRRQQESALRYCPISTKLELFLEHGEEVPRVMFESPSSNVRREKLLFTCMEPLGGMYAMERSHWLGHSH